MSKAIRMHKRELISVLALAVLGIAVVIAILIRQGTTLPGWLPGGTDAFELRAEFSSAQAVTPGQGQTVDIAGIRVGEVKSVEIEDGHAVVTMSVRREYAPLVHDDATLLLRPKTGLNDMVIELDPGVGDGTIQEGATVPLAQTQPNVQPDEILASLDGDTRSYLTLLLQGAATGLRGRGEELAAGLRRFGPTSRDLARINTGLAKRRRSISRAIHNFRLLSEELGQNDQQVVEFVESSNAVLGHFARQERSIRETLEELPPALRATHGALASTDRFALEAAPAFRRLRPAARAFGPAMKAVRPFFEDTRVPIRDQIRPFARDIQPTVEHLRQGSKPLARTVPLLRDSFKDLNYALNELAFNPAGGEEGFLYWASWFNHAVNALFTIQDAHGPLRRGIVLQSCQTAKLAEAVGNTHPFIQTLLDITRVPTSADIDPHATGGCPQ